MKILLANGLDGIPIKPNTARQGTSDDLNELRMKSFYVLKLFCALSDIDILRQGNLCL